MTTVIATKTRMVSDTFVSFEVSFKGAPKIWIAKGCAWGGAGSSASLSQFKLWTQGRAKRPEFPKPEGESEDEATASLQVLQLHPKNGIFLWINADIPDLVDEPFYAIGTGAGYAVGAMSKGATPEEALEIAAKWDTGTRLPGHVITVADLAPDKRGRTTNRPKSRGK